MSKILRIDTSPSVVIQMLNEAIRKQYPFIKSIVFSADQTYEDSIVAGRTIDYSVWQGKAKFIDPSKKNLLPMLSWTRSILHQSDTGLGRKFQAREYILSKEKDMKADAFIGQIDYSFNIFTTNMNDVERFEIDWYTGKGLRDKFTEIRVDLKGDLGVFSYSIIWERDLSSIDWSLEGNYYKSVAGSAKINGTFTSIEQTIKDPNSKNGLIYGYNLQMVDCEGKVLYENEYRIDPTTKETEYDAHRHLPEDKDTSLEEIIEKQKENKND